MLALLPPELLMTVALGRSRQINNLTWIG